MAILHIEPKEDDLLQQTKLAAANKEPVAIDANTLSMLAYGYFRYREIENELHRAGCGGHYQMVVADVCRLIGKHQALQQFAQGSGALPSPGVIDEQLAQWERWARLLLQGNETVYSTDDGQQLLQDRIGEMCGALEGGRRYLEDQVAVLADENKELHAKLRQWEEWAEVVAPKCSSDQDRRESIRARLKSG